MSMLWRCVMRFVLTGESRAWITRSDDRSMRLSEMKKLSREETD